MSAKKSILIIEDDLNIQQLYSAILSSEGYDIQTASDGDEGLTKAKAGGFNLILLDMMLPKMSGLEILGALKQKPPTIPNGPIVILTNLSHNTVVDEALKLGAKSCFTKVNLAPDDVVKQVAQLLQENTTPAS